MQKMTYLRLCKPVLISDFASSEGTVLAIIKNKDMCACAATGDECGVLLDSTNFYAESGGQIFDQGLLFVDCAEGVGTSFRVSNVQVHAGYVLHVGQVQSGTLSIGDRVKTLIDEVSSKVTLQKYSGGGGGG